MKSLLVGTERLPLQSVQLSLQPCLRLQVVWDPRLTRWYGWEWDGFGLACVEPYDLYNPFVDHTLRLIQHNWVVLAYNFNIVILVLIIEESSIRAFLLILLLQFYPCYYLALSFYSHTC
jgi:hypothetical protein